MSQEVDERVVEMRFDNAQFEKNVHQTMQSLEKLNDSLRLDGAEKGFEKIGDASAKVDFDEMQGALDERKVFGRGSDGRCGPEPHYEAGH